MPNNRSQTFPQDDDLATVIGLYALGEYSLGEAADHLDISQLWMRDILKDAGVELRLGASSKEELDT